MAKFISLLKTIILLIFFGVSISSCVNLKAVNDYSTSSLSSIKKYEDLHYSFTIHCIERCNFELVRKFEIKRDNEATCDCEDFKKADQATSLIYQGIVGYFDGLSKLSNKDLTTYNLDGLKKSLNEGTFGDIKIEKEQVDSYSKIANILLRATTDAYRNKKIKSYIGDANEPIHKLLTSFQFIINDNLKKELDFKKEKLFSYYQELKKGKTLTDFENGKATTEYYHQLSDINTKQKQMEIFAKGLSKISEGHQKLYENRDKMTAEEIKQLIMTFSIDIKGMVSEFNKLNK
ncbi:hypothetical protein [Salmonirosea aquatica]|uniref:Uncharacterized protein n=1 Tax=Salmonirosea aquatica TaxID=2654236 RepID=A0A7C9FQ07_9BACT|nr:hypothetical protein [Cytophagaceae bacterium SJW1-29]